MVSAQLSGAGTGLGQSRRDGEVLEEDHVALRLLRFRSLHWHQRNNAFTIPYLTFLSIDAAPNEK